MPLNGPFSHAFCEFSVPYGLYDPGLLNKLFVWINQYFGNLFLASLTGDFLNTLFAPLPRLNNTVCIQQFVAILFLY